MIVNRPRGRCCALAPEGRITSMQRTSHGKNGGSLLILVLGAYEGEERK